MLYVRSVIFKTLPDIYATHLAFRIFNVFFFLLSALKFATIAKVMLENFALLKEKLNLLNSPKT